MRITSHLYNVRLQLARIIGILMLCSVMVTMIPAGEVSAYKTRGALGRSLNVAPGFTVIRNMLAFPDTICRGGQTLTDFAGVTIHETSNWRPGADAALHARYLRGTGKDYEVSWHYSVDNKKAYQSIPESEKAWHAGDTRFGKGNAQTIAIEICDNSSGNFDQAMANAEWLAADILYRHGVYTVTDHLFQHNQFSAYQKNCPITIRDKGRWEEFSTKTQMFLDQMVLAGGTVSVTDVERVLTMTGTPVMTNPLSMVHIYADDYQWVGAATVSGGSFTYTINADYFSAGWHVLRFAAIDDYGNVKWTMLDYQVGPGAKTIIESLENESTVYGDIEVSGWSMSFSGVSQVDIYADSTILLGSVIGLTERPEISDDVNASKRYLDSLHCGFTYTIDAGTLSEGPHVIKAVATSVDGTKDFIIRSITVGPNIQLCLDQPGTGELGGDVTVSGWALSTAGIAQMDVYVDNTLFVGSTSDMQARSDVNSVINTDGQYKDGLYSGFTYIIDAGLLTPGKHTLQVAANSKDGTVKWYNSSFLVGPASQANLESPLRTGNGGDIAVSGWAVSHAGIARVDIYADSNVWIGSTSNIYIRSDVDSAVNASGKYKDARNSGFSYVIPDGVLSPGTHDIKVAAISKDGTAQWIVRTIVVE
jgi:hypothetical protein